MGIGPVQVKRRREKDWVVGSSSSKVIVAAVFVFEMVEQPPPHHHPFFPFTFPSPFPPPLTTPLQACQTALAKAGLTMDDMDLIEINEAFAAQYAACAHDLKVDESKTNLNGGAIALGHPLGASGSRIMTHLTHELIRTGKKYGIGSACCGGGQGVAIIIEKA